VYRLERVGEWDIGWRRHASGWQVVRWTATSHLVSRARRPIFTEITDASLGRIDSFRRQLAVDLDSWMATLDSVLTRDSNGHHGVSVGDADGDGLDDLYIAQPAGLPNRLYRNRGDSTFEDITSDAGVAVLDDTAQSLFADMDNDAIKISSSPRRLACCCSSTMARGTSHSSRTPSASRSRFKVC
jgi:hypothetical protein